jgi:hypothetical protein
MPSIISVGSDTVASGAAMTPFTIKADGYPIPSLKASGLPAGLRLTNNKNGTGTIVGTPPSAGLFVVTITAKSKIGVSSQQLSLLVT